VRRKIGSASVLIACRDGSRAPFLAPTHSQFGEHGLPTWRTFRDAVAGLEETQQEYVRFPEKRLVYYRQLTAGQNWRNLPEALQRKALGKSFEAGGGKTGFFRRLAWDKPAPTLVTHPAMPATDLCHPQMDRPLSVQEYARVQQFPDDWRFAGALLDRYRQIGNAVPVVSGRRGGAISGSPFGRKKRQRPCRLCLFALQGHQSSGLGISSGGRAEAIRDGDLVIAQGLDQGPGFPANLLGNFQHDVIGASTTQRVPIVATD